MKSYKELMQIGIFTINDADQFYGNRNSTNSAIKSLINKGLITKIKRNLYICNNIHNNLPAVDKFQIGCYMAKDAYISHHSALEYYGFCQPKLLDEYNNCDIYKCNIEEYDDDNNIIPKKIIKCNNKHSSINYDNKSHQLSVVHVSSSCRFKPFSYNNILYKHALSRFSDGVTSNNLQIGIRVTNIERTVIDCIKDIKRVGGIDELLTCFDSISVLDINRMLRYLDLYDTEILYQRTGFIMEHSKHKYKVKQKFYDICSAKIKNTHYFTNCYDEYQSYIKKWHLLVPSELVNNIRWK